MKTTSEKIRLEAEIAFLKNKQAEDLLILKEQYYRTVESFKPVNLIKSATREFISSPNLKSNVINGAIGIGTSYLTKNLLNEDSVNPIKRVLGKVLKFAVKNFIGKKSKKI
jgi:hypothetical protein